jgi:PAS domain S-box-containing protein
MDEERLILERLGRGERIDHFETVRLSKGGKAVDISLTVSPIRNAAGRIIGASKVARDITERRRVEQKSFAALRLKGCLPAPQLITRLRFHLLCVF